MDLDTAMDMMNQEQLMNTIAQLDSALASYLAPSPSTSPPQVHHRPVTTTPMPVPPSGRRRRGGGARVSSEPQSVAARLRRERVSQRMRALQRLVPGGARLDTASMLEEAVRYVRFLKSHVQALEQAAAAMDADAVAAEGFYSSSCCPYYRLAS